VKLCISIWDGSSVHRDEIENPTAADVLTAIERLDGHADVFLNLEKPHAYVAVSGGPERYLVTGEMSDDTILQLTDPGAGDEPVPLVVGGQLTDFARHGLVGREKAIEVFMRFLERGDYDPDLAWDIQ
jgi:hypothetical protein